MVNLLNCQKPFWKLFVGNKIIFNFTISFWFWPHLELFEIRIFEGAPAGKIVIWLCISYAYINKFLRYKGYTKWGFHFRNQRIKELFCPNRYWAWVDWSVEFDFDSFKINVKYRFWSLKNDFRNNRRSPLGYKKHSFCNTVSKFFKVFLETNTLSFCFNLSY